MSTRHNHRRDAFGFSVRGLTTTAFGGVPHVVADDAINGVWDEKLRKISDKRESAAGPAAAPVSRRWRSVFGLPG